MPINYRVDHDKRLVVALGHGVLTDAEVFGYQREAWSRTDVRGYNELVDMTRVSKIELPSADRIKDLARLAAAMDTGAAGSKFAIVAPADLAFGLGKMFQTYRSLMPQSQKEVGVFRTMEEALAFLEVQGPVTLPATG